MKVNIESDTYKVRWRHQRVPDPLHINGVTTCTIERVNGNNKYKTVATGETYCSFKDAYNKNTGRKIALTRALQKLFPSITEKEIRRGFWREYYKMRNNQW